jgi:hypothetical protein
MKGDNPLMQRLRENPRDFFKFLQVFDKETKQLVPFELNAEQEILLDALLEYNRVVVCKARQIGCSTLIRAYFLWKQYVAEQPSTSVILSYTRDSADHLHSIDKGFYVNLPKPLIRKLSKSSSRTLTFKDTGATLRSFTAGGKAGSTRSFSFTSAHISEFAFFDDQDDLLANVMASVGNGQIVIETTPNTPGDKYHDLVMSAPGNGWHVCFFPWYKHKLYEIKSQFHHPNVPDMDEGELQIQKQFGLSKAQMYWRRTQVSSMGIEKFRREFPATIDEAFLSQNQLFFPPDLLDKVHRTTFSGTKWSDGEIIKGDRYYMGVDVSLGSGKDYSSIVIISGTTLQPVYVYRDNAILPEKLAELVFSLHHEYNTASVIVEADGPGYTVLYRLKEWRMKNLYKSKNSKDWYTRGDNKIKIFDHVRSLLGSGYFESLPTPLWSEMRTLTISDKGSPGHPKGGNDDTIMAFCLAQWYAFEYPTPTITQTTISLMDKFRKKHRVKQLRNNGPIPFKRKEW